MPPNITTTGIKGFGLWMIRAAILVLVAWIVFGFWISLVGLAVGVVLLDFGLQSALVANQHIGFALALEARSRANMVLAGSMFLGGAISSAGATLAWGAGGWPAAWVLGGLLAVLATALQLGQRAK